MTEKTSAENERFSNPPSVPLVLDVEQDIKIPLDTVDNRKEIIDTFNPQDVEEYGRPNLALSRDELIAKLKQKDIQNLRTIDRSFARGDIDEETRDFLYAYYGDSKQIYENFKQSINKLFGCEPKSIKYINLLDGHIDNETAYFEEHVGPSTTMAYEYEIDAPWRLENQIPGAHPEKITITVVMPKMKDVNRAIEKVQKGGKYDLERQKELAKLKPGQTIEEAGLDKAKLRTPLQKMKDILRCTILAPRYDDILALYSYSLDNNLATKSSRPSKYLDNDIKNAQAFFKNAKNYRDMKNYLHIDSSTGNRQFFSEVQYKTNIQFFRADIKTHLEYEEARKLQQEFYQVPTEGDRQLINTKIYNHLLNIQKLNSKAFEQYNINILQDARKMEDKLKAAGVKSQKDGSFDLCRRLLDANLLVRSSVALTNETFQNSPAWVKDIYNRYYRNIDKKYLVDIRTYQAKNDKTH